MDITASPPAIHRGLAFLIGTLGAIIANSIVLMLLGLIVVLFLLNFQGKLTEYATFGITTLLPIGIGLIFVWGVVRRGAPGTEQSVEAGVLFAIITILRLALLGGIFLTAVLALSPRHLTHLLQTFGLRGQPLAITVSILNLWSDFQHHIEQICTGRCARGLMPNRGFIMRVKQFPFAVRTLLLSVLTYTLDRAETWESSGLIGRLDDLNKSSTVSQSYCQQVGFWLLAMSVVWTGAAIFSVFYY